MGLKGRVDVRDLGAVICGYLCGRAVRENFPLAHIRAQIARLAA
jgi:hypothetical protein